MARERILVFDPDSRHSADVCECLRAAGLTADSADSIDDLFRAIEDAPPDLVLFDWNLPGMSGASVLAGMQERRAKGSVRVLISSTLGSESDIVTGLESGADDYLTKPCSLKELVARVHALLRGRRRFEPAERMEVGSLVLDLADRRAYAGGQVLELHGAQLRLLAHFMTYRDHALSRAQLVNPVWGHAASVDERTVDVNVRRLRQVLAGVGLAHYVQTVRGIGYRLSARG